MLVVGRGGEPRDEWKHGCPGQCTGLKSLLVRIAESKTVYCPWNFPLALSLSIFVCLARMRQLDYLVRGPNRQMLTICKLVPFNSPTAYILFFYIRFLSLFSWMKYFNKEVLPPKYMYASSLTLVSLWYRSTSLTQPKMISRGFAYGRLWTSCSSIKS